MEDSLKTIQERINYIMQREGHTLSTFAKKVGISWQAAKNISINRNAPSYDILVKICRAFPTIDANWLLLGEERSDMQDPVQEKKYLTLSMKLQETIELLVKSNSQLTEANKKLAEKIVK